MNRCKKCGSEFTPQKGLTNYCSMSCRNSRERPDDVRRKISESIRKTAFWESEEWKTNHAEANRSEERIKKLKETWIGKRDYQNAHIGSLKRWYLEDNQSCENCGISEWMGKPITLEVHHRDSDVSNNTFENFQALCPNCHSLTEGWRGRNVL